jgi:translation initiation factor 3 subunit D
MTFHTPHTLILTVITPLPLPKKHTGKYLLVKDPNKELLRLYAVPEDAFETNYTEEPLAEADEVPADSLPTVAEEGGDE